MNSQGFFGALAQYWTIDEKPRLDRRNTYFEDKQLSNVDALRFGVAVSLLATAIVVFWQLMVVLI